VVDRSAVRGARESSRARKLEKTKGGLGKKGEGSGVKPNGPRILISRAGRESASSQTGLSNRKKQRGGFEKAQQKHVKESNILRRGEGSPRSGFDVKPDLPP